MSKITEFNEGFKSVPGNTSALQFADGQWYLIVVDPRQAPIKTKFSAALSVYVLSDYYTDSGDKTGNPPVWISRTLYVNAKAGDLDAIDDLCGEERKVIMVAAEFDYLYNDDETPMLNKQTGKHSYRKVLHFQNPPNLDSDKVAELEVPQPRKVVNGEAVAIVRKPIGPAKLG